MRRVLRGNWLGRVSVALLAAALVLLALPSPAFAIADPDDHEIRGIDIYRHCLETDDMLVVVKYFLDYTANPDENVVEAYLGRLMDGTTELGSVAPYAFYDEGYDLGVWAIYFSAADAPSWGGTYTIEFVGNPTLSWSGDPPATTSTGLGWHATATQNATESILSLRILTLADDLEVAWSVNMVDTTASGNTLSTYGEAYFANVVPDLRSMCPNIFPSGVLTPSFEEQDYSMSYSDQLRERWLGTGFDERAEALSDYVGIPQMFLTTILWLLATGAVGYGVSRGVGSTKPMLILIVPMLTVGALLGWVPLALILVVGLFCVLAMGYVFFFRVSGA